MAGDCGAPRSTTPTTPSHRRAPPGCPTTGHGATRSAAAAASTRWCTCADTATTSTTGPSRVHGVGLRVRAALLPAHGDGHRPGSALPRHQRADASRARPQPRTPTPCPRSSSTVRPQPVSRLTDDFNGAHAEGAGWHDLSISDGTRQSTAAAYLHPVREQQAQPDRLHRVARPEAALRRRPVRRCRVRTRRRARHRLRRRRGGDQRGRGGFAPVAAAVRGRAGRRAPSRWRRRRARPARRGPQSARPPAVRRRLRGGPTDPRRTDQPRRDVDAVAQ